MTGRTAPRPRRRGTLYVSPNGTRRRGRHAVRPDDAHLGDHPHRRRRDDLPARRDLQPAPQTVTIAPGNNGTSSARKNLSAYPGETPVLNFSAQTEDSANRGLALNGNYWHIYGLVVERAGDNGIFVGGSNNIIERTVTRFNRDSGPADLAGSPRAPRRASGRPTTSS